MGVSGVGRFAWAWGRKHEGMVERWNAGMPMQRRGLRSSMQHSIFILLALLLTVVITGYRLKQSVGGSARTVFLSVLAFTSTYILVNQLLMSLL